MVRRASNAVAVHADTAGNIAHRRLTHAELQKRGDQLATIMQQGLNPDNLSVQCTMGGELIADDKNCERLTVEWGEAPHGCRLIIREISVSDHPSAVDAGAGEAVRTRLTWI